jgi:hypothetical protein
MYVYDGNTTDVESLVNTETGVILPSDIRSRTSDMIVVFTSDFSVGMAGFKATIRFLQPGNSINITK